MVHPEKGPRGQTRFSSCSLSPVHPEKGPRGRLVFLHVVGPLVLGCHGKACLASLLVFLKRLQGKACMSVGFVALQSLSWFTIQLMHTTSKQILIVIIIAIKY